jgi:probable rRNA maturation factor
MGGAEDDDPGPSLNILIDCDSWHSLTGAEDIMGRAYDEAARLIEGIAGRDVTLLLSSDSKIAALNATYRGQDKATNVLSFPSAAAPFPGEPAPLGDIIIAHETVMREADEENKQPLSHLAHLTIHGLLHLAGYDHDTDHEAERMEQMERIILSKIGVSDPYRILPEDEPVTTG